MQSSSHIAKCQQFSTYRTSKTLLKITYLSYLPATMPFPWWKPVKTEPPSYSSLKREEDDGSEDNLNSENGFLENPSQDRRARKRFILSLTINGALGVILVLLLLLGPPKGLAKKRLLPTPVPDFPNEVRTFKLDPLYLSLPSKESNEAWESLPGPNGMGFIRLEPDNGFDFPDTKAGLSVFHQLHCLGALRGFMWDLVYGRVDTERMLRGWPENATTPTYHQAIHGMWHYAHCFDYLRQGIQCSGDTSLEFVSENTGLAVVDGLDYPHECKNWDALWGYAREYM
ncbi:uncharacterized protein GGS22DRAFT_158984 [Annulohypoxylon maeteangense]|uniref:uncharacterized protein n=1 Tax=Annulohypoxylon maeteangense TaxID=1927788 RepID=UPI0020076AAE|nr:uncharacterized protein GGS22DRAFT_158984 [Annulohypoxylon maeteangense]KAI0886927.1 hypothetical protein GGS22DRAFT_158984 [Annulohypoxylon maeteangense]